MDPIPAGDQSLLSPQFPDVVEFCEEMANKGKTVIVAALDGTFQRKPFGDILNLVPLAESVVKLNAVCMECYREASYTKRLGAEKEVRPPLKFTGINICFCASSFLPI
ncbi:hypothetical protein AB205_0191630 [Aquarana catesbeiana]|uniref:Thymidine kinase n=1 Tax=Aquarana catesbeiana TaxID=8400 RepID=A0A2G9R8Z4_AQUCT|nr:hypothetical protein AB205_0191630 [Aquarana catesbeiana]